MAKKFLNGKKAGLWSLLGLVVTLGVALTPSFAPATELIVDVSQGNSPYAVSSNITYDNETVGETGVGVLNQSSFVNTVNNALTLGNIATGNGTYNLSGTGSLSVSSFESLGAAGTGTFIQSGGTHTVTGDVTFGAQTGGVGTYTLSSGSLTAQDEYLGFNGRGNFNQSGGTNTVNAIDAFTGYLTLGVNGGSTGAYNLSGTGSLAVNRDLTIGYDGTGTFTQSGGTNTVGGSLYLGYNPGSHGTYILSGTGGLSVTGDEAVGFNGTGTLTQSGGTHSVTGSLTLGANADASGTYNLSGGSLSVSGGEAIGPSGTGTFTQTGGTHTVDLLDLGSGGTGAYLLSGGNLSSPQEYIGHLGGTGTFTQSGGTNNVTALSVSNVPGSRGTYNLSGGSLNAGNENIADDGTGTFNQSGGTHTLTGDLSLANSANATGTYNLSGTGSLAVSGAEYVGKNGTATFNQSSGTHTVSGSLYQGYNGGASGTYNLSGGSLSALNEVVGASGTGAFTQSAGSNTLSNVLALGNNNASANGTYKLSGGSLSAGYEDIGFWGIGAFTQTGGSHTVINNLELGLNPGSTGTYNLNGGSLSAGNLGLGLEGSGTFTQTGGTNAVSSELDLGGNTSASNGTYNLSGGSLTAASEYVGNIGPGTFNQTGGTNTVDSLYIQTANGAYNLNGAGILKAFNVYGNLTNGGTVNPGHSVGTMTVTGSYTQTASGTLGVEVASPTSYDKVAVTGTPGTASLDGAVNPILLNGYIPQANQVFPGVVTATGGVSGAFSTVGNFTPTLAGRALYSPNEVDLMAVRNYTNSALNLTGNQRAVGAMLNGVAGTATGDLNTVLNTIDNLTTPGAVANAYQQISADKVAALSTLAFAGANLQKGVLSRRLTDLRFAGREGGVLGGLPGSLGLNYSQLSGLMLAYNSSSLAGMVTSERKAGLAAPQGRWGVYIDPAMVFGAQQSSANQTGFNFTIAGFNAGADYRVRDDLLVGLASGYSHTGAAFHGSGGSVENSTWPLTAYAAYLPQSFYAYGSLGYALNLFDLKRQISFGTLNRTATSSPTGNQLNAYGEAGYDLKFSRLVVTPVVSLAYSSLWVDSFNESGAGALDLNVSSQHASSLQTGVGGKIALPLRRNSVVVVPQIYATYQHEYSDSSRGLDSRLSQAGSTFTFQTDNPHRNFAVAGASVNILTGKNLQVQLDYNAEVGRGNYSAHYASAGVRWQF